MKAMELEKVAVDMTPSMIMDCNLQFRHLFYKNEMLF
jgi:hypothetical protein